MKRISDEAADTEVFDTEVNGESVLCTDDKSINIIVLRSEGFCHIMKIIEGCRDVFSAAFIQYHCMQEGYQRQVLVWQGAML